MIDIIIPVAIVVAVLLVCVLIYVAFYRVSSCPCGRVMVDFFRVVSSVGTAGSKE
jgi:type III secretory pathway component EscV